MRISLTKNQWERMSEILGNLGLLSIGSIVIPAVFDKSNPILVILGSVAAIGFFYASLMTARKY